MTTSTATESRFRCASCEIEITGRSTIHVGLAFCCAGCVAGGPCTCSYDTIADLTTAGMEPTWSVHDCLDVTAVDYEPSEVVASRR